MEPPSDKERRPDTRSGQIDKTLAARADTVAGASVLSLWEYRSLLEGITPPSDEQISGFAEFLSGAHSWYKHLPVSPPGAPFQIFLNPYAGMDRVVTQDGGTNFVRRPDDARGFHYSWMPTSKYRSRYGVLDYFTDRGTTFLVETTLSSETETLKGNLVVDSTWPLVLNHQTGTFHHVPAEVRTAGLVHLTSAVHEIAQHPHSWMMPWKRFRRLPELRWPDELGGKKTAARVLELCAEYERCIDLLFTPASEIGKAPQQVRDPDRSDHDRLLKPIETEFKQIMSAMREWHLVKIRAAATKIIHLVYG